MSEQSKQIPSANPAIASLAKDVDTLPQWFADELVTQTKLATDRDIRQKN